MRVAVQRKFRLHGVGDNFRGKPGFVGCSRLAFSCCPLCTTRVELTIFLGRPPSPTRYSASIPYPIRYDRISVSIPCRSLFRDARTFSFISIFLFLLDNLVVFGIPVCPSHAKYDLALTLRFPKSKAERGQLNNKEVVCVSSITSRLWSSVESCSAP